MKKGFFRKVLPLLLIFMLIGGGSISLGQIETTTICINPLSQVNTSEINNDCSAFNHAGNEWNHTFGGSSYDESYSVQQTNDGGYIFTGATLSYGAGNWDVWLIKTDANGVEQWNQTYGGSNYDKAESVKQTADDGYIITGCTASFGAGNWDVWLIKTDALGNIIWNTTFGGNNVDRGYSVQQTTDFGYIISGYTDSYGAGQSDVWLIKTDSNGNEIWNATFGGTDYDRGFSVQQTNDDGYILTGYTVSYDIDATGCDIYLVKTDANGKKEWHQTFGGNGITNKFDMGYSVQQTTDGGYIITGDTEIYFVAKADFYLIKTNPNGNEEWSQIFGGYDVDRARSVQQTNDHGYIIIGWTSSFGPRDPDIWLIKTDANGNENWNATYGYAINSSDWGYSIKQTNDQGYIFVGATMPDGWKTTKSTRSFFREGTDIWLLKIKGENHPPDTPIIDGPNSGKPGVEYTFCINASDPDDNSLFVLWNWGDGTVGDWLGPYISGTEVCDSHSWNETGTYNISVTVRDEYGEGVTVYKEVIIPRTRATYYSFLHWFLNRFPLLERMLYLLR